MRLHFDCFSGNDTQTGAGPQGAALGRYILGKADYLLGLFKGGSVPEEGCIT